MINETILFLTYYYEPAEKGQPVLRHVIKAFCPAYLPFDMYIAEPLKKIFSKVIVYDFLKRRAEIGLEAMNGEIIALVKKESPKYVLWTSFYDDVQQATLEQIRAAGSKTIGWFFDDDWRFNIYSKYWIPYLDYVVTNCLGAVPKYKALGAQVIQTIPNTGIAIVPDWEHLKEIHDVSFVGTAKFADRRRYITALRTSGIPVDLFGDGFGGYVSFERMLEIFGTSKINLNFSKAGVYYWDQQIKGRVFQACMAGGFVLSEYAPGIENYFEIGKEIVCFETAQEMVKQIEYYLHHDAESRAIARSGWERASREYPSSVMTAKVFQEIERLPVKEAEKTTLEAKHFAMPDRILRFPSEYHLEWARAVIQDDGDRSISGEAIALSLRYDRVNFWARIFAFAATSPPQLHLAIFKQYLRQRRIRVLVLRRLQSIGLLRKLAEPVFRKLW